MRFIMHELFIICSLYDVKYDLIELNNYNSFSLNADSHIHEENKWLFIELWNICYDHVTCQLFIDPSNSMIHHNLTMKY